MDFFVQIIQTKEQPEIFVTTMTRNVFTMVLRLNSSQKFEIITHESKKNQTTHDNANNY